MSTQQTLVPVWVTVTIEDKEGYNGNRGNNLCSAFSEAIGYLVAITTMATIIFSTHEWSLYDLPKPWH